MISFSPFGAIDDAVYLEKVLPPIDADLSAMRRKRVLPTKSYILGEKPAAIKDGKDFSPSAWTEAFALWCSEVYACATSMYLVHVLWGSVLGSGEVASGPINLFMSHPEMRGHRECICGYAQDVCDS